MMWGDGCGVAFYRSRKAYAKRLYRELYGRMRDELLNEKLFLSMTRARVEISN